MTEPRYQIHEDDHARYEVHELGADAPTTIKDTHEEAVEWVIRIGDPTVGLHRRFVNCRAAQWRV